MTDNEIQVQQTWRLTGHIREGDAVCHVHIDESPFRIGRRGDVSLSIPSVLVSGMHAELLLGPSALFLRDLGSTNGTFVNGARIHKEVELNAGDLVQFADVIFRVERGAPTEVRTTEHADSGNIALSLIQFDQLMTERAVLTFFQPIVRIENHEVVGFEVLGRSRIFGLREPRAMFRAASVLNSQAELSRMFREEGLRSSVDLPGKHMLFLNTHPAELQEQDLLELSMRELRDSNAQQPLALEIHEGAVTCPRQMKELQSTLKDLDIAIAYDDFGAGQARLLELAEVPPDYLKFDGNLIRNIHEAPPARTRMIGNLVRMSLDLGITPIVEGIERPEERDLCRDIGFQIGQGFLFAKPGAAKSFSEEVPQDSEASG